MVSHPDEPESVSAPTRRLRLVFETLEDFRAEFQTHLVRGGLFVPCEETAELREELTVELVLEFRGASFDLPAEVVSLVPPELAARGGTPGIAVQVQMPVAELRERFAAIAGQVSDPDPGKVPGERRAALRMPAQVVARLATDEGCIDGRTRDISRTGVLVTPEGAPVPVGERVTLSLLHPTSGDELQIRGSVARHVETEGGVSAVGVHFDDDEAARPDVRAFVEELQSVEHARRLAGISGAIDEIGLANLLQSFAACTSRGTLHVKRGNEVGRVVFEDSMLVSAQLGPASGVKALSRLFTWRDGSFDFHARVDDADREDMPTALDASVLEAMTDLDEMARIPALPVDGAARLRVDAKTLKAARAQLSKTEEAVVELAQAGFSVRGLIDVIPERDVAVLEALHALFERRVLSAA